MGEPKVGAPQSHSIHQWQHYGMCGKPLVCIGVHITEVTMEQQLLLLWRISNEKKYVHLTIPFLLCSYSSTAMCQYWDNRLIYWAVYWLFYWRFPINKTLLCYSNKPFLTVYSWRSITWLTVVPPPIHHIIIPEPKKSYYKDTHMIKTTVGVNFVLLSMTCFALLSVVITWSVNTQKEHWIVSATHAGGMTMQSDLVKSAAQEFMYVPSLP